MTDGFIVGGAFLSLQSGFGPVVDGINRLPRFCIVMRQQFRAALSHLLGLGNQHVGNTPVPLLASLTKQGFVGRILNQGVLERESGAGEESSLMDKVGSHKGREFGLQSFRVEWRDGREQLKSKLASNDGCQLGDVLCRAEIIEPGHQRILQRAGDRDGTQTAPVVSAAD